jgi:acyl carrier protein
MAAPLSEIAAIVREVVRDGELDLSSTTRFEDLNNWDSMDLIAVVVEIECRFSLQFDLPEIDRLVTIGDLLSMIEVKQALAMA